MASSEGIRSLFSHATLRTFPQAVYLRKPIPVESGRRSGRHDLARHGEALLCRQGVIAVRPSGDRRSPRRRER